MLYVWLWIYIMTLRLQLTRRPVIFTSVHSKGPSVTDEFLPEKHFEQNAIKKVYDATRELTFFFLARHFHTRTRREMHEAVTRFASYWPLAVASAARDAFTHTRITHRTISFAHYTNEHAKFPHRRDERIFAIGCSNPVGPPSTTCEVRSWNFLSIERYENYRIYGAIVRQKWI